jgi:hypothetical protein
MRKSALIVLIILLLTALNLEAQTTNSTRNAAATASPRLTGRVVDPSGAVMVGVDVKIYQGTNLVKESKSDERGSFSFELPAGEYRVEAELDAFTPFRQNVRVAGNTATLTIAMKIATLSANVDAGARTDEVSLDEDKNLTSTSISGEAVKDLAEDEDALMAQLQALAGGSGAAGANATFVVDGISGGRVPPRDQIQSIIIDTNVFSAESVGGMPRIQIITKPGAGPWSGNMTVWYNDQSFNARNPSIPFKRDNRQRIFQTSYGGPLIPGKLTFRLNAREAKIENEGSATRAITLEGPVTDAVISPAENRNVNGNGQLFLTTNNTLNFGFNYGQNRIENQGVTDLNLPERAYDMRLDNTNFNVSTRSIIGTKGVFETRFGFGHQIQKSKPRSDAVQINVLGAFNSGGAQNRRNDSRNNYATGTTLRWTLSPKLNSSTGFDLFYNDNYSFSEANFGGTFTFPSLEAYRLQQPVTYRRSFGDPSLDVSQTEVGIFTQFDIRLNAKTNIGTGVRYQLQSNLHDYNNLAPTLQVAYQATKKTVIRAGGRLNYVPFGINNVEQLLRFDGTTRQFETVVLNPSYPDPFLSGNGTTSGTGNSTLRIRDPKLRAASNVNSAITLEQTLPKAWRIAVSLDQTRGMNTIRTRNINAPYPGTPLPLDLQLRLNSRDSAVQTAARAEVDQLRPMYPYVNNVYSFESTGKSVSKNLGLRLFTPNNLTLFKVGLNATINYTYGRARDNLSAQNQYDFNSDWAYSSFDARHRMFGIFSLRLPRTTTMSFIMMANSGNPYTVTTGLDDNGDQSTNDRPASYARNADRGPGRLNVDMNFSKQFSLTKGEQPRSAGAPGAPAGAPPVRQFTEGQIIMAGPGGGPMIMGPPPPPPGGPGAGGLKMNFNVQVANVFNNAQLRQYNGVISSPFFRQSNTAFDGRRVRLGLGFTF